MFFFWTAIQSRVKDYDGAHFDVSKKYMNPRAKRLFRKQANKYPGFIVFSEQPFRHASRIALVPILTTQKEHMNPRVKTLILKKR